MTSRGQYINPIALSWSKGVYQYCTASFDRLRTIGKLNSEGRIT